MYRWRKKNRKGKLCNCQMSIISNTHFFSLIPDFEKAIEWNWVVDQTWWLSGPTSSTPSGWETTGVGPPTGTEGPRQSRDLTGPLSLTRLAHSASTEPALPGDRSRRFFTSALLQTQRLEFSPQARAWPSCIPERQLCQWHRQSLRPSHPSWSGPETTLVEARVAWTASSTPLPSSPS